MGEDEILRRAIALVTIVHSPIAGFDYAVLVGGVESTRHSTQREAEETALSLQTKVCDTIRDALKAELETQRVFFAAERSVGALGKYSPVSIRPRRLVHVRVQAPVDLDVIVRRP